MRFMTYLFGALMVLSVAGFLWLINAFGPASHLR
jgi:hypothetical protein